MKKIVYLNFNLDNQQDLELYNLLESLGRNKKNIVRLALLKDGWLSSGTSIPSRVVSKPNSKKKSTTKQYYQKQEQPIQNVLSQVFDDTPVKEPVVSTPSYEERPSLNQSEQSYESAHTYVVDSGRDSLPSSDGDVIPQIARRYFTEEQLATIRTMSHLNFEVLSNENFCQIMREELGDNSDRGSISDAYQEAQWSN